MVLINELEPIVKYILLIFKTLDLWLINYYQMLKGSGFFSVIQKSTK